MRAYLSEKELEQLVAQLEKQELYAPGNLKEKILSRALYAEQPKPSALFSYRLKVIAGMAAALAMLFLIPLQNKEERLLTSGWEADAEESLARNPDWEEDGGFDWDEKEDRERTGEKKEAVSIHVALKESGQKAQQNMSGLLERLQKNHK